MMEVQYILSFAPVLKFLSFSHALEIWDFDSRRKRGMQINDEQFLSCAVKHKDRQYASKCVNSIVVGFDLRPTILGSFKGRNPKLANLKME